MRIESMDATINSTASITKVQAKQEASVESAKSLNLLSKEVQKESNTEYTKEELSNAFVEKAIDKANYTFEIQNRSLRFKIHERTNEVIVKVIDSETQEVIREIPPEKLLDMFANMLEMAGLLVDERR